MEVGEWEQRFPKGIWRSCFPGKSLSWLRVERKVVYKVTDEERHGGRRGRVSCFWETMAKVWMCIAATGKWKLWTNDLIYFNPSSRSGWLIILTHDQYTQLHLKTSGPWGPRVATTRDWHSLCLALVCGAPRRKCSYKDHCSFWWWSGPLKGGWWEDGRKREKSICSWKYGRRLLDMWQIMDTCSKAGLTTQSITKAFLMWFLFVHGDEEVTGHFSFLCTHCFSSFSFSFSC